MPTYRVPADQADITVARLEKLERVVSVTTIGSDVEIVTAARDKNETR